MRIKMRKRLGVYHCVSRVVDRRRVLLEVEKEVMRKILWRVADFCGVELLTCQRSFGFDPHSLV